MFANDQIWGVWRCDGFPDEVCLAGRRFRKARLKVSEEGVSEQYRECVAQNSYHVKVYENGVWVFDHIDKFNPDVGLLNAAFHFFVDVPAGREIAAGAAVAGLGLAMFGIGAALVKS